MKTPEAGERILVSMTSNQLAYWRDQETARTNRAKESETHRHNKEDESIRNLQNELEARGLDIKDKEQLLKIMDLYGKYGYMDLNQLPPEVRTQIGSAFGFNPMSGDFGSVTTDIWHEIKQVLSSKAVGSIIGGLF